MANLHETMEDLQIKIETMIQAYSLRQNRYDLILQNIKDEELKQNIGDDWKRVNRATKLVYKIHQNKSMYDQGQILVGFYEELNRAVSQGNNLDEKVKMLRQYCDEVEEQMKDNAEELMVVTNA